MTKVEELLRDMQKEKYGGVKDKLRSFLVGKKDEVYNRSELRELFQDSASHTIDVYLQELIKEKEIDKIKFGRIAFYGNKRAIEQLKKASTSKKIGLANFSKKVRKDSRDIRVKKGR